MCQLWLRTYCIRVITELCIISIPNNKSEKVNNFDFGITLFSNTIILKEMSYYTPKRRLYWPPERCVYKVWISPVIFLPVPNYILLIYTILQHSTWFFNFTKVIWKYVHIIFENLTNHILFVAFKYIYIYLLNTIYIYI